MENDDSNIFHAVAILDIAKVLSNLNLLLLSPKDTGKCNIYNIMDRHDNSNR
jgi:hypothetical protein